MNNVITIKRPKTSEYKKLRKKKNPNGKNYINNKDFTDAVDTWINSESVQAYKELTTRIKTIKEEKDFDQIHVDELEELKKDYYKKAVNKLPNYISQCFIELADRIGSKPNFYRYTYINDMKGDAVLLCIKYAHNFNLDKCGTGGAFAYFSQIVHNAFKQYLNKEKKYANQKFEMTKEELGGSESHDYNNIMKSNRDEYGRYIDGDETFETFGAKEEEL